MKEQAIVVQLQSQMICSYILHLPAATKTHSSYEVKLQKKVKFTQNSQALKEGAAHAKKDSIKKFEIQGGGPEVAVTIARVNHSRESIQPSISWCKMSA